MLIHKNRNLLLNIFYITIFVILSFIFSYKISNTALLSYDEAWYAEIARNIIVTGNPLKLIFNGEVFTDHPPFGYILMSLSVFVFGNNEFAVRFISVLSGALSIILVYFIGKKLKDEYTGAISALVIFSCMWFVLRIRSGNLDLPFVFFECLTVLFLLKTVENKKYFYFSIISFALLFLTKTLVGLGLLPLFIFTLAFHYQDKKTIALNKINKLEMLKGLLIFFLIVSPWYFYNQFLNSNFLYHHFIEIGTRGSNNSYSFSALTQSLSYLQIGVGKWYKVFFVSILATILLFFRNKKERFKILFLFIWFGGFSIFLLSSKTEIWHLLPLYPAFSLIIGYGCISFIQNYFYDKKLVKITLTIFFLLISAYQFKQFSNLTYFEKEVFSGEKDICMKAKKYHDLFLVEPFFPACVYYSEQNIVQLHLDPKAFEKMSAMLVNKENMVFIIGKSHKKDLEKNDITFKILEENLYYYLITN